ncbi:MAG: PD40 domain-containing protein [Anaerolineales bacterium]|nr:PD40 domain-containing protein [Anaerolineales bacterium]
MFKKALSGAQNLFKKMLRPFYLVSRLGPVLGILFSSLFFPSGIWKKAIAWYHWSGMTYHPAPGSSYRRIRRITMWPGEIVHRLASTCQHPIRTWLSTILHLFTPVRYFIARIRAQFDLPVRKTISRFGQFILHIAAYIWKELGQLGIATRKILTLFLFPLLKTAKWIWEKTISRFVEPAFKAIQNRIQIVKIKSHARRIDRQARRQMRQLIKNAGEYRVQPRVAFGSPLLVRVIILLATLNAVSIIIMVRLYMYDRPQTEANAAPQPVVLISPSSTITPSPTATSLPTPIPITPAPTVDFQAAGGSIAYVLRHNGNQDIYCLTIGQQNPIRLTNHPSADRDPSWSPDGRQLAFSSRRDGNWELYLLDLPTMDTVRLTYDIAFEANPTWSPDGQWLAYETYHNGNLDIFIMPVTGGDPVQLTSHPALDYAPSWSPSGRHLAFISWRDGNPDLFLFSLDDARDEASVNVSRSPDIEEDHPSWHPGGDYLAFTGREGSRQLVYIQTMRNNLPAAEPFAAAEGRDPTWSPNGDSVLYAYDEGDRHYLLSSPVEGWGIAPELYKSDYTLESPVWNSLGMPSALIFSRSLDNGNNSHPFIEIVADPSQEGPPYTLVTVDEVQASGPYLNDRVDDSFVALRQRVEIEVGWDFLASLDKMWEPLKAAPPPGLNAKSWNKAGRAFDIARELNTGVKPMIEVVREIVDCGPANSLCTGTGTFWRVYIRAARQDGSQGEPLRTRPWNFSARYSGNTQDYETGGRLKDEIPTGYYVDLTQLAADYGWERVPAGRTWRTYYPATLFWLYENRQELAWEEAMQEIYTLEELSQVFGDIWE